MMAKAVAPALAKNRTMEVAMASASLYILALIAFITFASPTYDTTQRVLAWVLFVLGIQPTVAFIRRPSGVPLLQFVALQYVVLFSLPVFFEESLQTLSGPEVPNSPAITMALGCAVLALISVRVGYAIAARSIRVRLAFLSFPASERRLYLYATTITVGGLFMLYGAITVSAAFTQPAYVVLSQDLGIAIVALQVHKGLLPRWQRVAAHALFAVTLLVGLTSGSTQFFLQPVLIWFTCQWMATGRGPKKGALLILVAFFLLQPIKSEYRARVWYARTAPSQTERILLYGGLIVDHYSSIGRNADVLGEEVKSSATSRLSLLLTTAHYIDLTPSSVDFKNGKTLMYMTYTWVPRILWPSKPTAQLANRLLPIEYGLQTEEGAKTTMFGVGNVAEVYTNFGAFGIVPGFLLMGILYCLPIQLLRTSRNTAETAVVIAVLVNLMWIGSTISQAFGGILQQIVVQGLLLRMFTMTRAQPTFTRRSGAGEGKASPLAEPLVLRR